MSKRKSATVAVASGPAKRRSTRPAAGPSAPAAAAASPAKDDSAGLPAACAALAELLSGNARLPGHQVMAGLLLDAGVHMAAGLAALAAAEATLTEGGDGAAAADAELAAAEAALARTRRRLALTWLLALRQVHGCQCCRAAAAPSIEEELSDTCNSSSSCGTAAE